MTTKRPYRRGRTVSAPGARLTATELSRLRAVEQRDGVSHADWMMRHVAEDEKMTSKTVYTISAINSQGASTSAGIDMDHPNGGREFTSINDAASAARRELGSGWKVFITDDNGKTVKQFTIR